MSERKLIIINEDIKDYFTAEEIIRKYAKLAKSEANNFMLSYPENNFEFDDIYQVALMSLYHVYSKYDYKYKVGFGQIAKISIRREFSKIKHYRARSKRACKTSVEFCFEDFDYIIGKDLINPVINKIAVRKAWKVLKPKEKQILFESYWLGYKYKEIADKHNLAYITIVKSVQDSLKKLKKNLKEAI